MRMRIRTSAAAIAGALGLFGGLVSVSTGASGAAVDCTTNQAVLPEMSFVVTHVDGTTQVADWLPLPGLLRAGDHIEATFHLNPACDTVVLSAASYIAPSAIFSGENQMQQVFFDGRSATYHPNGQPLAVTMGVTLPLTAINFNAADCPNPHLTSDKTYNGNGGSAVDGNQYASTCDGRASANGNGGGTATGRPCQGCVGNADNKNPKGQFPNGTDANNGYECDGNHGIARGNPAHTGCAGTAHFQVDYVVGPLRQHFVVNGVYDPYPYDTIIHAASALG